VSAGMTGTARNLVEVSDIDFLGLHYILSRNSW
jgi:hypothetical protein